MDEIQQNKLVGEYPHGFSTNIASDRIEPGLTEETVRTISKKKNEPLWMLNRRLAALAAFWEKKDPNWSDVSFPKIDYQAMSYYSEPQNSKGKPGSLEDIDEEILETYRKLGIPLQEQKQLAGIAVDAVFDSVSVGTTFKAELEKVGIIFCPISEAIALYPELIKKYMFTVVPHSDNKFACLNAAVFSGGSFVYVPPNTKAPMELSTYFRINDINTGQFERTLIVADKGSYVSYLEGCTAPIRKESQLHAAVVELVALEDAEIKYSTVQNWYPGSETGVGGIYNFVTKRGACKGDNSKISWTQVEVGSSITWKYPSCVLYGKNSQGFFHSIAVTKNRQQADTGSKMVHVGKNTKSQIISKGVSMGHSIQTYRGLVDIKPSASNSSNYTRCDALIINDTAVANTIPYIRCDNGTSTIEHEASASKVRDDQLFYCQQRGMTQEEAVNIVVSGFCKEVIKELPMEFALEARKLLNVVLEGCVG